MHLRLIAGPKARAHLLEHGLRQADFSVMVGASGGPKWLALAKLDQYLFGEFFRDRDVPLHLIGSSAGAWRFTCFARKDPVAASAAFAHAYQEIAYPRGISVAEVTERSQVLLHAVLPDRDAAQEILGNPHIKLNLVVARAKGITTARQRGLQAASLGVTALANAVHRRTLGAFFERVLFHAADAQPPFYHINDLPTRRVPLAADNLRDAVLASGSIPLVLSGVPDIAGAGPGIYYDGGITDYHFDIPFTDDGLVLYPHFYPYASPGWFDKSLKWRRAQPKHYENVLMVCPSPAWIAALPYGKIPDRKDFGRMSHEQKVAYWGETIARSEQLADEFHQLTMDRDRLAHHLRTT